jgi:hypothetical protein
MATITIATFYTCKLSSVSTRNTVLILIPVYSCGVSSFCCSSLVYTEGGDSILPAYAIAIFPLALAAVDFDDLPFT